MKDFEPKGYWEAIEKFASHMPTKEHKDLSILKGHLLIEEQLNILIYNNVRYPAELRDARLEFNQKIVLAKSFGLRDQDINWIWAAIEKLNKIRNRMAHTLDDAGLEDRIVDFISYVEANIIVPNQDDHVTDMGILNMAIFNVYHFLSADIHM